jgi:hypothetical protein
MKIVFFVEGYTEILLIKELVSYYYNENLSYALFKLHGGSKIPISISLNEKKMLKGELQSIRFISMIVED